MKKQIEWTLGNGSKATFSVELQLEKEINLDGDKSIVPCCEYHERLEIPGMGFMFTEIKKIEPKTVNGKTIVAAIGGKVGITEDIYSQITAAINEVKSAPEWIAKQGAIKRNEAERKADYAKKIKNGYCPKCGSYCHGDCSN